MATDMEGWRGNFENEIIKQWIVHERDIFLGNSGHILGYANLGYEKAITPKWTGQNTVFPKLKKKRGKRVGGLWWREGMGGERRDKKRKWRKEKE